MPSWIMKPRVPSNANLDKAGKEMNLELYFPFDLCLVLL
jgi:hypothetical protein